MGENHSFLALDWVKGEIEETLKQARQALEAHVENPEDATRMRFCLAYLHQVYGTLHMVEFYGAALLAEEMEKLCLALINDKVARVDEGQEVLMRAILQLPPYLDRVKASRRDLPVILLPLLNDLRAVRGEPLLSETALFTPDLAAGERAPIQVTAAPADPALVKKIRQMYQVALLGLIRADKVEQNLGYMTQVFVRLEKIAGPSPMRELWQVADAIIEGLLQKSIDAGTAIKMLLGQVDRQLRKLGDDADQRPPTELMKNLLYYVAKSPGQTAKLRAVKDLYRLDDALPTDALVNEERARMAGPDREAMKSVVDALCEELARVKDALDIFVRATEPKIAEISTLVPVLKQVADTVAVLGLGQPRRILQEQIEVIDGITAAGELPKDGRLLDVAGALLYVEATLMGMVAEKPLSPAGGVVTDLSGKEQLSDAQAAVLRESRSALESSKDAVIEFIASQWNPVHLEPIPDLIGTVRGGLMILNMPRPADLLARTSRYISERLLKEQHRPDWAEMDTIADIITSVEYYLERVANDSHGGESVLDIAENGLKKLGYGEAAAQAETIEEDSAPEADLGEWDDSEASALEIELSAEPEAVPAEPLPVETREDEVLLAAPAPEPEFIAEVEAEPAPAELTLDDLTLEEAVPAPLPEEDDALGRTLTRMDALELPESQPSSLGESIELEDFGDLDAPLPVIDPFADAALPPAEPLATPDWMTSEEITLEDITLGTDAGFDGLPVDPAPLAADSGFDALELEALIEAPAPQHHATPETALSLDDDLALEVAVEPEPAPVAPAAVVEPPKKPILPVLTNMPVDDHDFDEEIREIFVEEAEEVLEMINEYFPQWAANFENHSALLEFRRGFHTLKGSGRMVGAKVVGELAWSIESLLNKVRDNILAPNQSMVNLISEVLAVIPGLVEDFQNRQPPRINTGPLMAAAEAIARGEALSTVVIAQAAEQAHAGTAEVEPAAALEPEATFAADDFDALAASLAPRAEPAPVADEVESLVAELPAEAYSVDASEVPADFPFADEFEAELASLNEPTVPATADVDPVLLEIFTSEADSHLSEIKLFLDLVDRSRSSVTITDQVLRSLHTLKGSAGMAGIASVADIAAPMEHLFKDLRNQSGSARREHLEALERAHDLILGSIHDLMAGGSGQIVGGEVLIAHIRQLDHDRLAALEKSEAERLELSVGEVATSEAMTVATIGRVASFMALGLDHVLDAPWELDGWLNGLEREEKLTVLREELLRLAPAARRGELESLALTAERLASVYSRLQDGNLPVSNELLNDLSAAHDDIVNVFDTLAASQTVVPNEAVLENLLDWLEVPAVSVEDEFAGAFEVVPDDEPVNASFVVEEKPSLADIVVDGVEDNAAAAGLAEPSDEPLDPELLEIFLEEAEEVLEAADQELSDWRANTANKGPLAVLQRQLHTLKGGARLAEIKALGDLAHELEFLYEGLTDGRYHAESGLIDLVQRCHDRLADMVADLRATGRCAGAADLVNAINSYRRNPEAGLNLQAVEAVAAEPVAPESEVLELAALEPEPVVEEAVEEPLPVAELVEPVAEPEPFADIELSVDSAAASEAMAEPALPEPEPLPESTVVVEVAPEEDTAALFAEFFPEAAAEPVAPAPVVQPEPEPVAPVAAVASPAPQPLVAFSADFDPELLEIFLEEAGEIVDATSEQLQTWLGDVNNTLPVQQLQRGLHTLKGGARMAEISPLGDLAHQMEDLYEGLCDGIYTATPALFQLLHRCHDRLAVAVEALHGQQGCPDTSDLIAQIRNYIADPLHFQDTPVAVTLTPHQPEPEPEPVAVEPEPPKAPPVPRAIEAAEVPEQVDADILEIFFEESEELAEGIEASIGQWLEERESSQPLEALMRHLHTLKGGARLAGLKELGDLAHDFEHDLVGIQQGSRPADDAFFSGLNGRLDRILEALKQVREKAGPAPAPVVEAPVSEAPVVDAPAAVAAPVAEAPAATPAAVIPFPVAREPLPLPAALQPQVMPAGPRVAPPPMSGSFKSQQNAKNGPQEMIRVPSDLLEKLVNLAGETSITRSRVEMGVHGFAQTVEEMGATIQRLADQLRRMDAEMETQIISRHNEEKESAAKYEEFDPLEMDQYSSLNQLSKALAESASDLLDLKSTLIDKARDTETLLLQQSRINTELQEGLMRSRMVPFSRLVPRLKRIVRQTGQEVNKPADLDVVNAEGEMDRTLLERVVAPLEHMLRNAVDHGIEKPEGRAAAGKPAQGRVTLSLAREGGEVVLTLADDGGGINVAAVRKKAIERGLITADAAVSDQEVIQFIFHAGFSTAEKVTQISGRGVGMDVVQSEIKQMGGVVSISSVVGQGTTFTIRLPFTVAVNRALMVRIGEDVYAIPLSQIEGIVRASPYELEAYYAPGAPLFEYAGVAYKLHYLGEFVHGVKSPNLLGHTLPLPVLLIRGGEGRIAIQVDQLIGSREIVVKSVGIQLATVAGISGATILGDGSVVIILDAIAMLRAASISQPRISVSGQTPALPAAETVRTRTVMVVDDSVTVRKVTSRLLERHGYEVVLAKDGMDAIAKLEDQRPDLMLLDIEMPRMDGFEVASLVRHNPNLEDLPIIMITSRTGEKHRERAFQIGVNCYMGKPFQEDQLLETIAELLAAATVR